ncbi:MAG: class I SAM-dependent methyltransferase [Planctomycetaceae bacterium]
MKNSWNRFIYACWAPVYDGLIGVRPLREARARALDQLHLLPEERVLVVGVGTGADLPLLPSRVEVIAIDISRAMLRVAAGKLQKSPEQTQFVVADAMSLPFVENEFDAVVLTLILSVVPDGRACLREVSRVSRPQARIVVLDKFLATPAPPVWRRMANVLTQVFGTDINRRLEDLLVGTGLRIVTRQPAAFHGAYVLVELRHDSC